MGWVGGFPPGLGGGWDSPGRLLWGSETVPGFTPGWVGVGWIGGHSPWAERGGCDSPTWDMGLLVKGSVTVPGLILGWVGM